MHVRQTIQQYDHRLDTRLRAATNGRLCVETYKPAATLFRAIAIGTIAATAILPEASLSPTAYIVLAALALGPDVAEAILTR